MEMRRVEREKLLSIVDSRVIEKEKGTPLHRKMEREGEKKNGSTFFSNP